jgi:hypothetical protein
LDREVVEGEAGAGAQAEVEATQAGVVGGALLAPPAQDLAEETDVGGALIEAVEARGEVPLGDDDGEVALFDIISEAAALALGGGAEEVAQARAQDREEEVEQRGLAAAVAQPEHGVRAAADAAGAEVEGERGEAGVAVADRGEVGAHEARHGSRLLGVERGR